MRTLSPHEVVVEMLRTYVDVCGAGERGEGSDHSDDRVLTMNPLWGEGSYAELHRCLYELREQEQNLYWNVAERFLRMRHRRTFGCPECLQETNAGTRHVHHVHGQRLRFEPGPILQELWHPAVRLERVDLGVEWIVREHRGAPFLPFELYLLVAA